jgi:hypothetical protein
MPITIEDLKNTKKMISETKKLISPGKIQNVDCDKCGEVFGKSFVSKVESYKKAIVAKAAKPSPKASERVVDIASKLNMWLGAKASKIDEKIEKMKLKEKAAKDKKAAKKSTTPKKPKSASKKSSKSSKSSKSPSSYYEDLYYY